MYRKLLLFLLLTILPAAAIRAFPFYRFPTFPGRFFWNNPAAVSNDSTTVISDYTEVLLIRPWDIQNGIVPRRLYIQSFFAETMLPRKFGAIGIQASYMGEWPANYTYSSTAQLTYANGITLGGGRLSGGIQLEFSFLNDGWLGVSNSSIVIGKNLQPDFSLGLFYQHKQFQTGIALYNVIAPVFRSSGRPDYLIGRTDRTLNILLSDQYRLSNVWSVKTTLMSAVRLNSRIVFVNIPLQSIIHDSYLNMTGIYRNKYQMGATLNYYPRQAKVSINAGLQLDKINLFAIATVYDTWQGLPNPEDYRFGISYLLGKSSSKNNK